MQAFVKIKNRLKLFWDPRAALKQNANGIYKSIMDNDLFVPITDTLPGDIFIAGFPKSGNTWMQSLVAGLLFGIDTQYLSDHLAQEIVPDVHIRKLYKRFSNLNFFKTHHLPKPHYKKVIYLVRDGRDAMVSYYHFNKQFHPDIQLKDMIIEGKEVFPCSWHMHVRQWRSNPYGAEVMHLRYEDLLSEPLKQLKAVCSFAGIERDDDLIKKVISGNTFEKMKRKVEDYGGIGHVSWKGKKGSEFFRKGITGDYKREMPAELLDYFNERSREELNYFNYL